MATRITPSELVLKEVLISLRAANPGLGIAKLHALVLSAHPTWIVSEKRTRRVLQSEGLVLTPAAKKTEQVNDQPSDNIYPSSKLVEGLDVSKWTPKVEVKYFGKFKGKGLVAREKISEGETIWKEDPFILAPEWDIYDLQVSSLACMYCSTPLRGTLVASCPASSSASPCPARFCSRLCLSRSARTHPLLCPSQNPASAPLVSFARKTQWMALYALVQLTARILLTFQEDESALQEDWSFVRSLAALGMEDRAKGDWMKGVEPDRATWKQSFQLFIQTFQQPSTVQEKKKLARLLRKPLTKEITDYLFGYDSFLLWLGCMSLNLEAHGGLYVLHSHMNHSCTPSVSVRHLDQRTALSRISVIAKKDIEPDEELLITYVDPDLPVERRRRQLLEWGFGECQCERCTREAKDATSTSSSGVIADDLEAELKAGLGVI
ncbi:hypothetical protein AcW1_002297 [Taiwanofungus camphoratus]|nr:hypothetical protein AcW1_002297 [Antrodia cinnamomea]